jgi:hypothetical protein
MQKADLMSYLDYAIIANNISCPVMARNFSPAASQRDDYGFQSGYCANTFPNVNLIVSDPSEFITKIEATKTEFIQLKVMKSLVTI